MEKIINMQNGDVIIIDDMDRYYDNTLTINKGYMKNNQLLKTITFKKSYDFLIDGWAVSDKETNVITYDFEEDDPLYRYLSNLLGEKNVFKIDDDIAFEDNKKVVEIRRNNNRIILSIINELNKVSLIDKFSVCIINSIQYDLRSKADQHKSDTKEKLINFFNEIENDLFNEKLEDKEKVYKKQKEKM